MQKINIDTDNSFKLLHPFTLSLCGITQSGKTQLVKRLINEASSMIKPPPEKIIISYTEDQSAYREILQNQQHNVEFVQGMEGISMSMFHGREKVLLVIDDQMIDAVNNKCIQELFTKGVHHKSISVILISQNIFPQGKHGRDIRLNCQYFILMKSPTFNSQITYLGRQLFPSHPKFLPDAYKKGTMEPYSYLFVNLHPLCNDQCRVAQGIFENELLSIFIPK
jgi:hypothetical protein